MRKNLLILLINLLLPIQNFSQNTFPKIVQDSLIVITPNQLKQTNLIFLEHYKLKKENILLHRKIDLQKEINSKLNESLVIKDKSINNLNTIIDNHNKVINFQDYEIKKQKTKGKLFLIGGITVSVTSLILLIWK